MTSAYVYGQPAVRRKDSGKSVYSSESAQSSSTRIITLHRLTDDGSGGFVGGLGTVDYAGQSASVKLVSFWS